MHQTLAFRNNSWWYETDPLAKPLVTLSAPAYYATGLAMATGLNWISWRMGHSRRIYLLSWLGSSAYGAATSFSFGFTSTAERLYASPPPPRASMSNTLV